MAWSDGTNEYVTLAVGGNRGGAITTDGDEVWTFSLNGLVDQMEAPPAPQSISRSDRDPVKLGQPIATPQTPVYGGLPFDGTMYTYEYNFTPQVVQVPTGTTLTWKNDGSVIHTASCRRWLSRTPATSPVVEARGTRSRSTSQARSTSTAPHIPWMLGRVSVQSGSHC